MQIPSISEDVHVKGVIKGTRALLDALAESNLAGCTHGLGWSTPEQDNEVIPYHTSQHETGCATFYF